MSNFPGFVMVVPGQVPHYGVVVQLPCSPVVANRQSPERKAMEIEIQRLRTENFHLKQRHNSLSLSRELQEKSQRIDELEAQVNSLKEAIVLSQKSYQQVVIKFNQERNAKDWIENGRVPQSRMRNRAESTSCVAHKAPLRKFKKENGLFQKLAEQRRTIEDLRMTIVQGRSLVEELKETIVELQNKNNELTEANNWLEKEFVNRGNDIQEENKTIDQIRRDCAMKIARKKEEMLDLENEIEVLQEQIRRYRVQANPLRPRTILSLPIEFKKNSDKK